MLSKSALNNLAFLALTTPIEFRSILTLTYLVAPQDGRVCKSHLREFLNFFKGNYPDVNYLWILEFQKRGAPHYHILTTHHNPSQADRDYIATAWSVVIGSNHFPYCDLTTRDQYTDALKVKLVHKHERSWENIRTQAGARKYILKYALKPYQKIVPLDYVRVGRFWGCDHKVKPKRLVSGVDVTDEELRELLKDNPVKGWDIIPKIIFPR